MSSIVIATLHRALLILLVAVGCGDDSDPPSADGTTSPDEDATSSEGGETSCDGVGKPEMTGPIVGLEASYPAGEEMTIGVPVDEDTARVIVGIYEVGSSLYLGGNAEDVAASSTAQLDLFAGVAGGEVGTFFLSIELCSTSVCTPPFVRNTYDRADRTIPLMPDESYIQTKELVGGDGTPEPCESSIPIQSFLIE